jgi:hypothetical protein
MEKINMPTRSFNSKDFNTCPKCNKPYFIIGKRYSELDQDVCQCEHEGIKDVFSVPAWAGYGGGYCPKCGLPYFYVGDGEGNICKCDDYEESIR